MTPPDTPTPLARLSSLNPTGRAIEDAVAAALAWLRHPPISAELRASLRAYWGLLGFMTLAALIGGVVGIQLAPEGTRLETFASASGMSAEGTAIGALIGGLLWLALLGRPVLGAALLPRDATPVNLKLGVVAFALLAVGLGAGFMGGAFEGPRATGSLARGTFAALIVPWLLVHESSMAIHQQRRTLGFFMRLTLLLGLTMDLAWLFAGESGFPGNARALTLLGLPVTYLYCLFGSVGRYFWLYLIQLAIIGRLLVRWPALALLAMGLSLTAPELLSWNWQWSSIPYQFGSFARIWIMSTLAMALPYWLFLRTRSLALTVLALAVPAALIAVLHSGGWGTAYGSLPTLIGTYEVPSNSTSGTWTAWLIGAVNVGFVVAILRHPPDEQARRELAPRLPEITD